MPAICANFLMGSCPLGVRCRNIHISSRLNQNRNGGLPAPNIRTVQTPAQITTATNRVFTRRIILRRLPYSPYTRLGTPSSVRIYPQNSNEPITRPTPNPPGPVQLRLQNTNDIQPQRLNSSSNNIDNGQNVSMVNLGNNMNACIEDELQCDICLENYIKPTVLNCSHTFCHYCIEVWARNVNECPTCREPITNKLYCRGLDRFLDRINQYLPENARSRRDSLKVERNNKLVNGSLLAGRDVGESYNVVLGLTRRQQ